MTKGSFVLYTVRSATYRSLVKTVHRDGTVTVEPYFQVGDDGKDTGAFCGGFVVRVQASRCRPLEA